MTHSGDLESPRGINQPVPLAGPPDP